MRDDCSEMRLLVQADVDGELSPAEAARVAAHVEDCDRCADAQARLLALSGRMRTELARYPAPAALRTAIPQTGSPRPGRHRRGVWFGAGFAFAASLALFTLPRGGIDLPDALVASHIRALQPGHLMDVASSDQHTVKPWFDGRLDFAPPVRDLRGEGFDLTGGRLDYADGRYAAVLVYQRRQHVIDLYVWPLGGRPAALREGNRSGYNYVSWSRDGMAFWAISDINAGELSEFASKLQRDRG